jgi:multisubunit Na+/H+ antiporter MnhC subunit
MSPARDITAPQRCPVQFSRLFCRMAERTGDLSALPAVLAFIFGAIVIVASIGSFVLTLLAVFGIQI